MYTQCPDCNTAFRVTAEVLKQAAGKVRCGGCGNAFNALEFLSESLPDARPREEIEEQLPELKSEAKAPAELPESISAEQSAALLKTLDELAGSDIRIEDTGIEWRVLDEDEVGTAADDDIAEDIEVEDQPGMGDIFESSPTPVDQFLTSTPPEVDAPEIFAADANGPAKTPVEELRFDDNTPLPEDFGFEETPPVGSQEPEESVIDIPEPEPVAEAQVDLELTEPDEWEDILGEFEDIAEELAEPVDESPDESFERVSDDMLDESLEEASIDELPLEDLSAEAAPVDDEPDIVEDLDTLLLEPADEDGRLGGLLEEGRVDEVTAIEDADEDVDVTAEDDAALAVADESGQLELIDSDEDYAVADDLVVTEHYVPPMTEEEQTINMQIDEELLAIAVPDEDGFASTIVISQDDADLATSGRALADDTRDAGEAGDEAVTDALKESGAGFETIIMEGEKINATFDDDKFVADQKAALASLAGAAQAEREAAEAAARARRRKYGMAAGIVFLALALAGQYLHQARNSLATIPAFNNVVGPVYRALGQPLSPEWDVTGWRFETTRHVTDEADANLTISSRIGNNSGSALPYPIIAVSLSDRFEEPLGSVTLDPAEYLADDLDPRRLVEPGNTFEAAIQVNDVPDDTTTFRLRVCYRAASGDLRCKEDGFL